PPAGIAPIPYSVSPLLTLNSVGGKNSEKRSTRIPTAFATVKCPSSCRTISTTIPRRVSAQLMPSVLQVGSPQPGGRPPGCGRSGELGDSSRGLLAGAAIGLVERLEGEH